MPGPSRLVRRPGSFYYDDYRDGYYPPCGGLSRWGYYDPFDYNYGYSRPVPLPDHDKRPNQPTKPADNCRV